MAIPGISQGLLNHVSSFYDFNQWPIQEVLRIETLSETQVVTELKDIMKGLNYSWHTINQKLQAQLNTGVLEFTLEDGDVLFEWNNLCDEKLNWERKGELSASCAEFNRDCLINLKILPVKGAIALEGPELMTTNMDGWIVCTDDLWVDPEKWQSLMHESLWERVSSSMWDVSDDDDDLSWTSEDSESEYEDDMYEYLNSEDSREENESE